MSRNIESDHPADVEYRKYIDDLRGIIANSWRELGLSHEQVADEANLHETTVLNFVNRITGRIQARTLLNLQRVIELHRRQHPIQAPLPTPPSTVHPRREKPPRERHRPWKIERTRPRDERRQKRAVR